MKKAAILLLVLFAAFTIAGCYKAGGPDARAPIGRERPGDISVPERPSPIDRSGQLTEEQALFEEIAALQNSMQSIGASAGSLADNQDILTLYDGEMG